jgi:tetratricopeptide (TPR) repeat protein
MLVVLLASLRPPPVESEEQYWTKLMLGAQGKDDLAKYLAAVRVAERYGEDDPRLHIALYDAGVQCSWLNKRPQLAEQLLKRDIANLEKISVTFPDIVSDCFELANVYEIQGRYGEAETLLLRALDIRKKWKDVQSDNPFNAEIYSSLYVAYYVQGNDAKAADAQSQMLNALALWQTDKTRAQCLFKLDNNFYKYATRCKHLDPVKGKHLLEMALKFAAESAACYRRLYGETAFSMANLGVAEIYMALGRMAEAESIFRHILNIADVSQSFEKTNAFASLARLATILCSQHRINEVEQLQDQYLSKIARAFGEMSSTYVDEVKMCAEIWGNEKYPELEEKRRRQAQVIIAGWTKK